MINHEPIKDLEYRCHINSIHQTIILVINNRQHSFWPWIQKRYDKEHRECLNTLYAELNKTQEDYEKNDV